MQVLGTMNSGGVITTDTPPVEWDESTVTGKTFMRFETTDEKQFIKLVDETGATSLNLYTIDTWANRASATYKPLN